MTRTSWIKLDVPGTTSVMPCYVAQPDGEGPYSAILVIEEIFGINGFVRSVADRLAAEGYVAIAPDIHHRDGAGLDLGYEKEDREIGMQLIPKLTYDNLRADLGAAVAALRGNPAVKEGQLGCIGFCIGGHVAYLAAATPELGIKATASFYGGGIAVFGPGGTKPTVERTDGIKGKIVCFFGAEDASIPKAQVDTITTALETYGVRHEIVVYPNANHAFFNNDRTTNYDAVAATDAWTKVKALFGAELQA